jgi:hypothetical protein
MFEYWCQAADTETGESTIDPPAATSKLHASTTLDGTVRLDGTLDAVDGAIVTGELARLERQLYLADDNAGVTRSHSERMAAALVEMAARSASTPAGAQRPKPLFTVLLGDDTVANLCELANGVVIAPGTLVPHLGAAELETILFDGPFTVIAASTARSFTGRLRRAIEVRDRHCQHPSGCDVHVDSCDVDHIVPTSRAARPPSSTDGSNADPTTATPPNTTTTPSPTPNAPSPSSTRSAPASAGTPSTTTTTTTPTTATNTPPENERWIDPTRATTRPRATPAAPVRRLLMRRGCGGAALQSQLRLRLRRLEASSIELDTRTPM